MSDFEMSDYCGGMALKDLATRIESQATWEDLVLPRGLIEQLHEIAKQVRHRTQVYAVWGFEEKAPPELGVTALFAGEQGTGRTLAAEVLARDVGQDLYRIDLSRVVRKYIGETEKNLRRLFDAAESTGAVLLFDEADALFGKRSEVKDAHDRYANVEISYLMERTRSYRGLTIFKTALRSNIDRNVLQPRFVLEFGREACS
jgi:SpoVK/Ycf46/Vps4 family AAA+-type ATPase